MTSDAYPSDKQDKFMLRLPDGMRERIKTNADQNGRSMNAEIVAALEAAYPAADLDLVTLTEFVRAAIPGQPEGFYQFVAPKMLDDVYDALAKVTSRPTAKELASAKDEANKLKRA